MIVVVGVDADAIDGLADRQVERADSVAAAADALDRAATDVVTLPELDGASRLVRRIREGEFGNHRIPVVIVSETVPGDLPLLAFDQTVSPNDPKAVTESVELALAVAEYQSVIQRFYAECQDRAEQGITDPLEESRALQDLRDEADDRLSELLADPEVVADLLWTPQTAFDFGFGTVDDDRPG